MTNKRQTYSEETLQEAVRLCNEEGMSYGDAQQKTGIPKSTIHRYCKETVIKKQKPGPTSILTDAEELSLVQWAKGLVKVGFPATDSDLLDQVQKLLIKDKRKNPFENSRPSRGWLQHFLKKTSRFDS